VSFVPEMPIYSSAPPTSSTAPFSPASPFVSTTGDMPPATNTNIVLITELEKKLRLQQMCKVTSCSLSKVLDASGNAPQIQELEMKVAEQWKRQRSCDSRVSFVPEMPIYSSAPPTSSTAGSTNPIFTAVPPTATLATAPLGPVSPYVSANVDMPPMPSTTSANIVLIAELENRLKQEQVSKVASCPRSKSKVGHKMSHKASGNYLSHNASGNRPRKEEEEELEQKVVEDWRRQRSCDSRKLISVLEKKLDQERLSKRNSGNKSLPMNIKAERGSSAPAASLVRQHPTGLGEATSGSTVASSSPRSSAPHTSRGNHTQVAETAGGKAPGYASPGGTGWKKTVRPGVAKDDDLVFTSLVPDESAKRNNGAEESLAVETKEKNCLERLQNMISYCAGGFRKSKSRVSPQ